jgi:hypothetical protein
MLVGGENESVSVAYSLDLRGAPYAVQSPHEGVARPFWVLPVDPSREAPRVRVFRGALTEYPRPHLSSPPGTLPGWGSV